MDRRKHYKNIPRIWGVCAAGGHTSITRNGVYSQQGKDEEVSLKTKVIYRTCNLDRTVFFFFFFLRANEEALPAVHTKSWKG